MAVSAFQIQIPLGLTQPSGWTGASGEDLGQLHRRIATTADTKAAVYQLYLTLCAMEEAFDRDAWRNPTTLDKVYIAMPIELGYQAPDIDRKVLHPDNLEQIIATELGLDHPDTTTDDAALAEVVALAPATPTRTRSTPTWPPDTKIGWW